MIIKRFLLIGLLALLSTGCGQFPQTGANETPEYEWVMTAAEVCSYVEYNLNQKDYMDWYRELGVRTNMEVTATKALKQDDRRWKVYLDLIVRRQGYQRAYCYFTESTGFIGKLYFYD